MFLSRLPALLLLFGLSLALIGCDLREGTIVYDVDFPRADANVGSGGSSSGSSDGSDGSGSNGGGPARYVGVHIRTFGADMGIPRGVKPDAQLALSFYSWEVMVSAEADRVCVHRNAPLS